MYREYDSVRKTVYQTAVIIFYADSCLCQELFLVSFAACLVRQCSTFNRSPSEPILRNGLVSQSPAAEILICNSLTFLSRKAFFEELCRILRNEHQTLLTLSLSDNLGTLLFLYDFNVIFLGKISERLHIGHALMFHDKTYRRSRFSTTEALVDTFCRRYGKRRGLLIMERTACLIIGTPSLQSYKVPYNLLDPGRIYDLINYIAWNHILLLINFFVIHIICDHIPDLP